MMTTFLRAAMAGAAVCVTLAGCNEGGGATASNLEADTATNWVRELAKTDEGGFLMGNPDAPVKLVEFGSFSCGACAAFHDQAMTELKGQYIASGQVSYELRPFVRNGPDYVATALATCSTPQAFFALTDAFFENQGQWLQRFSQIPQEAAQQLQGLQPREAMVQMGRLGGLDEFVRGRGIPPTKYQQCVESEEAETLVEQVRTDATQNYDLTGTPTFGINGEKVDVVGWDNLKAELDAAL